MKELHGKISSLLKSRAGKDEKTRKDIDKKIVETVKAALLEAGDLEEELNSLLAVFDGKLLNILSRGAAMAITDMDNTTSEKFVGYLSTITKKPIVYYIIGELCRAEQMKEAMWLLEKCSDSITNNAGKAPSKKLLKSINAALYTGKGPKNPLNKLIEQDLNPGATLVLFFLIYDQELNEQRKTKSPVLEENILVKGSLVWKDLPAAQKEKFTATLRTLLEGKKIEGILKNKPVSSVPSEFVSQTGLIMPEGKATIPEESEAGAEQKKSKGLPSQLESQERQEIEVKDDMQPEALTWKSDTSPYQSAQKVAQWIKEAESKIRKLEHSNYQLIGENSKLKKRISDESSDRNKIEIQRDNLQEEVNLLANKVNTLQEDIKSQKTAHKEEMRRLGKEMEERDERLISETKNTIAYELKPLIQNMRSVAAQLEDNEQGEAVRFVFDTIYEALERLNIRIE